MDKDSTAPSEEKFLSGFGTAVGGTLAYRRYARGAQKCYKPITTRLPFLAGILLLTLALIAIVEIVLRQYPVDSDLGSLAAPNITRRFEYDASEDGRAGMNGAYQVEDIRARVASSLADLTTTSQEALTSDAATIDTRREDSPPTTTSDSERSRTPIDDRTRSSDVPITSVIQIPSGGATFLSVDSDTGLKSMHRTQVSAYVPSSTPSPSPPQTAPGGYLPTYTSIPSAHIPTTQPQSILTTITLPSDPPPSTTFTTTPGEYIPTEPPHGGATSVSGPPGGGGTWLSTPGGTVPSSPANTGASQPIIVPTSTITFPNAIDTSLVPLATHTSGGIAVVVFGSISAPSLVPISTYTSNGVALIVMGSSSTTSLVPVSTYTSDGAAYVVMGTPSKTSLVPVSTITSNGVAVVVLGSPTSQPTDPAALSNSYSVLVEQVTSTSGSVAYVYMTTLTLNPSQLASHTASGAAPHNTAATVSNPQKTTIAFTNMSYFAAWYLPTMVAVAFRVLWTVVYNNARLMEPFYRLASPAGVTGRDALDNLYLSMGSIVPEPILALLSGQSYMLLVSTIAYLIELVAPLSSEFLGVDVRHGCIPDPSLAQTVHPCPPHIIVRLVPARVLQGLLCLVAVFIIFTMFLSRNRPSGVYSDPSAIAVMASLLHHPDVLRDFKQLNPGNKEMEQAVKDQTYRLTHYQAEGEGLKYGIVPTIKVILPETINRGAYSVLANVEGGVNIRSHHQGLFTRHLFRTIGDAALALLLLGLFGVTLGYYLDGNSDRFNVFFNSDTFGPRFILTFAGGIAVSQWKRLEKEVRTLNPYRHLSSPHRSSSPLTTILSTSTSTPYATLPLTLARRAPFTALTALCYILSELLVIMVVTVPYSSDEYWLAFLAGTYITLSILGLQILTFFATVTWWRRTTPPLARDPDTLLGVWTLLAASSVREDFDDLGTAGRADLVSAVMAWDRRYWLGDVVGKDGVVTIGIHADGAHEEGRLERFRAETEGPPSPLPFSLPALPTVPKIMVSSDG